MKLRRLALTMLAVATQTAGAYAIGVSFPGQRAWLSPSKKWKIECKEDKEHEGAFALVLENTSTGIKNEIFEGGSYCDVLWSPDESQIAITDWLGSNCSEIFIQRASERGAAKELPESKNSLNVISEEESAGHCYREAVYWDNSGRLYFRVFGHTDTNPSTGFIYYFRFDPKSGNSILISRESGPNCDAEAKVYAERRK